jgi:hypothetical protein
MPRTVTLDRPIDPRTERRLASARERSREYRARQRQKNAAGHPDPHVKIIVGPLSEEAIVQGMERDGLVAGDAWPTRKAMADYLRQLVLEALAASAARHTSRRAAGKSS